MWKFARRNRKSIGGQNIFLSEELSSGVVEVSLLHFYISIINITYYSPILIHFTAISCEFTFWFASKHLIITSKGKLGSKLVK